MHACMRTQAIVATAFVCVFAGCVSRSGSQTSSCYNIDKKLHIHNHSSGYLLRMAIQHCIRAYLGPHCILAQKQYCQKLMA